MSTDLSLSPTVFRRFSAQVRRAEACFRPAQLLCRTRLAVLGASVVLAALGAFSSDAFGQSTSIVANQPMGEAKGVFPGRVVWVHDPAAVNQSCVVNTPGAAWYFPANNNQTVIDGMVSTALRNLTGTTNDSAAWAAVFQFHNAAVGKGAVNYVRGEKIFIKINATSAWAGNFNTADLTPNSDPTSPYSFVSETSVGPVLSVLRQLVNVVGADQSDIYVGDPLKHIYKHLYDAWHGEFPNVHYLDNSGYTNLGREVVVPSTTATITYSDKGTILETDPGDVPVTMDYLYTISDQADYVINIPMLKGHMRAGMTMFAKNNFGSQTRADASHLHNGLVAPTNWPDVTRGTYGLYRVQVDLMGHSMLGKKNLVFLMDALWSTDFELDLPLKWQMPPFNNTYMSSVFASLDPVAIESVGYDFLRSEFTATRVPAAGTYVQMPAVDDYLHQAADSTNWPTGIVYDPDNTGTPIGSLGTNERWNNATAMQYSRNLSPATGTGIELIQTAEAIGVDPIGDQTVVAGGSVSFTATATGMASLSYQWQREASGSSTWSNLSEGGTYTGTQTSTLTVVGTTTAMAGDLFRCVVSNGLNPNATTNAVTLTVTPDAAFLEQLFKAVLQRDIDSSALTSFGASLAAGGTPAEVLGDLFASSEYSLWQIEPAIRLYYAALARMPDYAGLQNWSNALHAGPLTLAGAADQFAASTEFNLKYGSLDNTGFVQQLYLNVLGRQADSAGLANWVNQLNSGASRGTVLIGFSESDEFKSDLASQVEIVRLYFLLLKRMPTATELQNWLEFLKGHGQTDNLFAQGYPAGLSDSDYVQTVFQGFLRRAADAGALSAFGSALDTGALTHGGLVDTLIGSAEFNQFVAPVSRLYIAAFHRVPDAGGLDNWVAYVRAGNSLQSAADAFVASPEFQLTYGSLTDAQYVTLLYENVLGREPDPGGLANWETQLSAGSTRGQVLTGFSESPEGIALFAPTLRTFLHYFTFLNAAPTQPQLAYWTDYLATLTAQLRQSILDDPAFTTGG